MQRTTLRNLVAIAAAVIVGIGLGVGGTIAVTQQDADRAATVSSYEVARDNLGDLELRVWVTTGTHPVFTQWVVEEKPDRVEVSVRERSRGDGPGTMEEVLTHLSWPLREPIGSRRVVDTSTGNDVPLTP